MQLETFRGDQLHKVVGQVRRALGEDAMIVRTKVKKRKGRKVVEIVAAPAQEVQALRTKLDGGRAAAERAQNRRNRLGPYTIALLGPSGSGKTSTAVKLALHPRGLGGRTVGFVTLDTLRVGAVEELQTYAEIAGIPLEVVYHEREVPGAMERLRSCDALVVDTPGRAPVASSRWHDVLRTIEPDEVHLVVPVGVRIDVARKARESFTSCGLTHVLLTKLDQVAGDVGLAEMAQAIELPARWVTDGQDIPSDLRVAGPRILAALGLGGEVEELYRAAG